MKNPGAGTPDAAELTNSQPAPYTGMEAPCTTLASSLHKNRMTRAISSGFGHCVKLAVGIAFRLAEVSMMLGRIEFTRTPVPDRRLHRKAP